MILWRRILAPPILLPALWGRPAMAKKTRKKAAAKAAKKSKGLKKKKTAAAKKHRKVLARKKSKPIAKKKPAHKKLPKPPPPESFPHKVEDVIKEIADIFTDAERLHQKLDPGVSREPE
jgi:phenylalanyl-tRNA synthetase alpha subunit